MSEIPDHFRLTTQPQAADKAVVRLPQTRFTLLTSRLLRLEFSPEERFEDRPSQVFWFREQPVPDFEVRREGELLEIETEYLLLRYQISQPFNPVNLSIQLKESGVLWHIGDTDDGNLGGTTRTLDNHAGPLPLEPGLVSRLGWTVVDDSNSLVFNEGGWLEPRKAPPGTLDLYFFGYGSAYQDCLLDFRLVSGPVGMLPRWALGNWWSRFWAYHDQDLLELMIDFRRHAIPLAVCIIDMDWHITQTGNLCSGWTGFTWNKELFSNPPEFLAQLDDLGLKKSLNLHPAEGFHRHEAQYGAMAHHIGADMEAGDPVAFDLEDPQFMQAYFDLVLHPEEAQGIDFWWMDWQQGNPARLPGLNLLWWINHLHYLDLGRESRQRPFIFSRWGGLGNHRYPIGFSGDTYVTWEALRFQPYFTATAANVAYGWWSHDIGGHMRGMEDPELYARWVQFGLFSPILRLHSTNNPFHERRPWGYDAEILRITRQTLQLRHAFIPYLYSMAWRDHSQGISLSRPMYYLHPQTPEAYACPDQYIFGSELLAAPFTSPRDPATGRSRQVIWLPEGGWFDFFSGEYFPGGNWTARYGGLEDIPVYARAGAIVPLGPQTGWGGVDNPTELEVMIFPGADHRFDLYEDDGSSQDFQKAARAITSFEQRWDEQSLNFSISPVDGSLDCVPERRAYRLVFRGVHPPDQVSARLNGQALKVETTYSPQRSELALRPVSLRPSDRLEVILEAGDKGLIDRQSRTGAHLLEMLHAFRLESWAKESLGATLLSWQNNPNQLSAFSQVLHPAQLQALLETITGAGMARINSSGQETWIVWNNEERLEVRFRLAVERLLFKPPPVRFALQEGTAPRFQAWVLEDDFGIDQARLELNYDTLLTLALEKMGKNPP